MRKRIVAASAATILAALTIPTIALAWPAPQPGHPACIPVGDGTYTIVQDAQPPFPKGSHQPEHGTCEGPVVQPPAPAPAPEPAPAPAPVVIVQQVPVPTPVQVEKVCVSRRVITHRVRKAYRQQRVLDVRASSPGYKTTVTRRNGRFVVSVDVRGERFTGFNNNVRTRVYVRTRGGWFRLVYKADTCRSKRGAADQNDTSSREPIIPVRHPARGTVGVTHGRAAR